ncbi:T9SS type A sorting domain-containing protein [Dyadobacter sandarakinus]|uniref:T9SS type A sorting domain-containing protein n=1 Tax=Dyadobacter sandarakinus TaxID=2747268 RepID=A0ABX7I700_9BACT|nr:T9SS type A sorting domain-containing protein [Dyadobacter sandarakinus]QRR01257.1 T9SS type A sorting domain-containing protein [Dyadobacter sandarakinus]
MRRSLLRLQILIICLGLSASLFAQPTIQWDKTIGGNNQDRLNSVQQTLDGGYILGGTSFSGVSGEKSESARGLGDYWIVKLAADGTKQWDRTFGGTGRETFYAIRQASDGSYFVAGQSYSDISGDKTDASNGAGDLWIINLAANGTTKWQKTIGTENNEFLSDMEVTPDGGLAIAAASSPIGPTGSGNNHGWFVKLSASGDLEWTRDYYVNFNTMRLAAVTLVPGGGYLLGADTSGGEDIGGAYYLIRVSAEGTTLWTKEIRGVNGGNNGNSALRSILATPDGGFLVGGLSRDQAGNDKSEDSYYGDYWVVKITANGVIEWDNTIQANDFERFAGMQLSGDGGYFLWGDTQSAIDLDKTDANSGVVNGWLVKLDVNGKQIWDKVIGSASDISFDSATDLVPTNDGGVLLAGFSDAPAGADKTESSRGANDYWIVKLAPESPLPVRLASFTARKELSSTSLSWQTTSETNSDHFEVQHSLHGKAWTNLTTIHAQGESNELNVYHYTHTTPVLGSDNLYRLKMVDADGSFTYSKIRHVKFEEEFTVSVYPNPAAETIHLKAADWSKVKGLQILNSQGKALYTSGTKPAQDISARSLKPGLYFIKVTLTDGTEATRKVAVGQ